MTSIIEDPVAHVCGWESDGGAFPEGAGCPKCGEPITADSLRVINKPSLSGVREQRRAEAVPAVYEGENPEESSGPVRDPKWLARTTVAEVAVYISEIETIQELAAFLEMETTGKNRKGILAAIDAQGIELTATRERKEPPVGGSSS